VFRVPIERRPGLSAFPNRVAAIVLLLFATAASAQDTHRFEITPLFGYRFGGSFDDVSRGGVASGPVEIGDSESFGLSAGVLFTPDSELELIWSHQDTSLRSAVPFDAGRSTLDLAIDTFHVGGLYLFSDGTERVRGFFSFGAGLTRFDPPAGYVSENRLSFSVGIGAKFFATPRLGVRVHARLIPTYFSSGDEAVFCSLPGSCVVTVNGDFVYQTEAAAGLVFAF